jgi:hypothetical protein
MKSRRKELRSCWGSSLGLLNPTCTLLDPSKEQERTLIKKKRKEEWIPPGLNLNSLTWKPGCWSST